MRSFSVTVLRSANNTTRVSLVFSPLAVPQLEQRGIRSIAVVTVYDFVEEIEVVASDPVLLQQRSCDALSEAHFAPTCQNMVKYLLIGF